MSEHSKAKTWPWGSDGLYFTLNIIYWLHSPLGINLSAFLSRPICLTPPPCKRPVSFLSSNLSFTIISLFQSVFCYWTHASPWLFSSGILRFQIQSPFLCFPSQGRGAVCHPPLSALLKAARVCCFTQSCVWLSTAAGLFSILRCKISKTTVCAHSYA